MSSQIPSMAAVSALPLAKKGLPLAKKGLPLATKYAKPVLKELAEVAESVFIGGNDPEPLSPPADIKAEQELFEEDLAARTWLEETWPQREMRNKVEADKASWEEEMTARNARWNREARNKLLKAQAKKVWVNRKKDQLKAEHPQWWTALRQKEMLENQREQQARVAQLPERRQHGRQGPGTRTRRGSEEVGGDGVHPRRPAHDSVDKQKRALESNNHASGPDSYAVHSTSLPIRHRQPVQGQASQNPHPNLMTAPRVSVKPASEEDDDNSDWSSYVSSSRPGFPHPHGSHQRSISAPPPALTVWHDSTLQPGGNDRVDAQGRHLDAFDRAQLSETSGHTGAQGQKVRGPLFSSEGHVRASSLSRRGERIMRQFDVDAYMQEEEQRKYDPVQRSSRLMPN